MKVSELIEELENFDPSAEVRIAHQPQWAFEYSIDEVCEVDLNDDYIECERCEERAAKFVVEEEGDEFAVCAFCHEDYVANDCPGTKIVGEDKEQMVVFISEGRQIGYLPSQAARAIGWK